MKKILILLTAIMLTFFLVSCDGKNNAPKDNGSGNSGSGGTENTGQTTPENNEPESLAALIGWMLDGTYYFSYTSDIIYDGQTMTSKGSFAADGDNIATTTEMTAAGQLVRSRLIAVNGITYIIDDTSKIIMKSPVNISQANNEMTDFSKIKYVGKGTGNVKGKALPYTEYISEGVTVKYYLNSGEVYAIESGAEGAKVLMVIEKSSKTIPSGSFDLPRGYTNIGL